MPSEIVLFDLQEILVTNRRFTVGRHSFSLRSIRSLHFLEHGRSWRPAAASASLSALSGLTAVTTSNPLLAIPAAGLSVLAAALFIYGAPRYSIGLDTEDGYFVPLTSRDRFLVEGVTKTLQSAAQRFGIPLSPYSDVAETFRSSLRVGAPTALGLGTPLVPIRGRLRTGHRKVNLAAAMPVRHRIHPV